MKFPSKIIKKLKRKRILFPRGISILFKDQNITENRNIMGNVNERLEVLSKTDNTKDEREESIINNSPIGNHSKMALEKNISKCIEKRMKKERYLKTEVSEASK